MTTDGLPIEPKLRRTVEWFQQHGFEVTECGYHDEEEEYGYVILAALPHNMMLEADRVFKLLLDQGACVIGAEDDVMIDSHYTPEINLCEIHICPISDASMFPESYKDKPN